MRPARETNHDGKRPSDEFTHACLQIPNQLTGSLVVARSEEDVKHLEELMKRGKTNGVKNLRIVRKAELRRMEPEIHPDAIAALYSPDAGKSHVADEG